MKKHLSLIMLGLLLISMIAFLPNNAHANTPAEYDAAIINAANRLVALQSVPGGLLNPADYAWNWLVTGLNQHDGDPSDSNQFGINALGLIDAYLITDNATYLTAAENTADFMMYGSASNGDFYNGYGAYGWAYSSDYEFLIQLSATTGNMSYRNYASAAWYWTRNSPDHPVYNNGSQAAFFGYFVEWTNYGGAGWGASEYGLVALQMGDTAWAQGLASMINSNLADIINGTTPGGPSQYKDLGMAWTLKFLVTVDPVTYASSIATLKADLKAYQLPDGSWSDGNPEGNAQTTAYAVMGLWTAGEYSAAQKGADWLVANQMTNGGWSAGSDEYSETDSEATWAVFTVTSYASALYISPASVNKTRSDVGTTFTVSVTLSNFGNLAGFDINLTWDNSLINVVSADKTPLNALWPAGWTTVYEQNGNGYYELAVVGLATFASNTGASILFNVTFQVANAESSNFPLSTQIHFALDKLSDIMANPITPTTVSDGTYTMSAIVPGLEFKVEKFNKKTSTWSPVTSPYDFECANNFTVSVYVTNVISLTGYDLTIDFNSTLVALPAVQTWGIFGTGTVVYTNEGSGASSVQISGTGSGWSGSEGLLFTLQFNVQFAATPDHTWNVAKPNYETFPIYISGATLDFTEGTIPMSGINMPASLNIEINFIRGDLLCTGVVGINDIRVLAYYFNQAVQPTGSAPPQYDLLNHGHIDIFDVVQVANNYGYGIDP